MLAGRALYGIGCESLGVGISSLISKWFKGKEINFALGLLLSLSRFAAVISGVITPGLYSKYSLGFALLTGFFVCVMSFISTILIAFVEKKYKNNFEKE